MDCVTTSEEYGGGGAIFWCGNDGGYVSNSTFVNCSATGNYGYGGAIKWEDENGAVDNCNFVDCSATLSGGAISLDCSDNVIIHNCNFINCSTTFDADEYIYASGGAIYLYECNNFTVDHCVLKIVLVLVLEELFIQIFQIIL